jgi:hypothetical protein
MLMPANGFTVPAMLTGLHAHAFSGASAAVTVTGASVGVAPVLSYAMPQPVEFPHDPGQGAVPDLMMVLPAAALLAIGAAYYRDLFGFGRGLASPPP